MSLPPPPVALPPSPPVNAALPPSSPPNTTSQPPSSSISPPPSPPSNATAQPPLSAISPPPPPSNATAQSPSSALAPPPPPPSNATVQPPSSALAPPPPPPPQPSSRSTPRSSSNSPPPPISTESESSSSMISGAAIVGIALGSLIVVAGLSLFFFCCFKKTKRRHSGNGNCCPPHPPSQPGDIDDLGMHQQWKHNAPSPPSGYALNMMQNRPAPLSWPSHHPSEPSSTNSGGLILNNSSSESPLPPFPTGINLSMSTFTYEELVMATDGFSVSNLLGQGGFGFVHKGVLPNGKEVAIKQLKAGSGQGEREFQAEVEIISRVHHRHLVSLVGYCIIGYQRLLVYEFVPNKTLEFHLHEKGRPTMDWAIRFKIAKGAAKGLAYLHEDCHPKIIHRDIKTANILLDYKFEAKVADFGLAKFTSDLNTHVSTRVMGTFGYMAPEYASSGKLTEKSDVFSFGVVLLELITGRRPIDIVGCSEDTLVDWAIPLLSRAAEGGGFDDIVDRRLNNEYSHGEMTRMTSCAAACVRRSARRRPQMGQVVRALEGDVSFSNLNEWVKTGQSTPYGSSDYDGDQYKEDMKKFRKVALGYTSSDYSMGLTSESGMYASGSSSGSHPKLYDIEKGRPGRESSAD